MSDIHALIREFLQQQTIVPLAPEGEGEAYTKAGLVPFVRDGDGFRFYVMKPRGRAPQLGAPSFQLCKGTRQHFVPGVGWHDIRGGGEGGGEREPLAGTALREGIEELGLKLGNIARLFDAGGFGFASATTGKPKRMWLFAAEMKREDDFLPDREVALVTETRQWMAAAEFSRAGREDHRLILEAVEARLRLVKG